MESDPVLIIFWICIAFMVIVFICQIPYYIREYKEWRDKKNTKRATISGKKVMKKYGDVIKKMAPFEKKTIFLKDDRSEKCDIDIEVAQKRKCVYVNYIFDFLKAIDEIDPVSDFTQNSDGEENSVYDDITLVQRAAFFELRETRGKFIITYYNHYEEEAYKWIFKSSSSAKQIIKQFLDADEWCRIEDEDLDLNALFLVKKIVRGTIGELDENPFRWKF